MKSAELRDFIKSDIWGLLKAVLEDRLEVVRSDHDDVEEATERPLSLVVKALISKGGIREIKYLIALPETLLEDLEAIEREGVENAEGRLDEPS